MRFIYLLLAMPLLCPTSLFAQNSMGSSNDLERIAITPVIHKGPDDLPSSACKMFLNKMRRIISLNGISAFDKDAMFIMFPEIVITDQHKTNTTPAMYAMQFDINIVIADQYTGNVFSSVNYKLKGAGKNKESACLQAINRINTREGKLKAFVNKGKNAIIEYYNVHCELVISRAESLAAQGEKEKALSLLNSVPTVCRECYDRANEVASKIKSK